MKRIGPALVVVTVLSLLHSRCADQVDRLAGQLDCGNWCDRSKAVKALGRLDDQRAVEPLLRALDDPNWRVRRQAVRSLTGTEDRDVTDRLIEVLDDRDWQVRREAVRALAGTGDPRVPETLIRALADRNRRVRAEAAWALARSGSPRAADALSNALADWHAGGAIAQALLKMGWGPGSERYRVHLWVATGQGDSLRARWQLARTMLLEDLGSSDRLKVENAVNALVSLGNPEVLQILVEALAENGSRSMAEVLASSGHPRLREAAESWADGRNTKLVRRPAVRPVVWGSW